jgi:hypothetical protein
LVADEVADGAGDDEVEQAEEEPARQSILPQLRGIRSLRGSMPPVVRKLPRQGRP